MYLITNKNIVIDFSKTYTEGDPKYKYTKDVIYMNDSAYGIPTQRLIEVEDVPKEVEPFAWCYTKEKGFYENPDWREPKPYTDEQYDAVVLELVKEGRL